MPTGLAKAFDHKLLQPITGSLDIPGHPIEQPLHAIGGAILDGFR
jgi:hypothetical protein